MLLAQLISTQPQAAEHWYCDVTIASSYSELKCTFSIMFKQDHCLRGLEVHLAKMWCQ
jgi:hypothetical protein